MRSEWGWRRNADTELALPSLHVMYLCFVRLVLNCQWVDYINAIAGICGWYKGVLFLCAANIFHISENWILSLLLTKMLQKLQRSGKGAQASLCNRE